MADDRVRPYAKHVVEKCGGPERLAVLLGINSCIICRWGRPKPVNGKGRGRGGFIPHEYQEKILELADLGLVDVTRDDFWYKRRKRRRKNRQIKKEAA